jgi:16S rRNA (guanine1516-N2)-methyltransferase
MGCDVQCIERHPVVAFLIQSALEKARHPLLDKFKFQSADALEFLDTSPYVEVIFYDPMFEDPNQKSMPRKEMRIFRSVVQSDQDIEAVMRKALGLSVRRVVVKRPRLSVPVISSPEVSVTYSGKATRYDVYLSQIHGPNESNQIK